MQFIINANTMTREQEIALEKFLEGNDFDWKCEFEKGE